MQHLDHSPTGRVLEGFAPARGDMHSPRATGQALSIHPVNEKYNFLKLLLVRTSGSVHDANAFGNFIFHMSNMLNTIQS